MGTWEQAHDNAERAQLRCPVCGGVDFEQQEGRMDSRWGVTSHRLVLMICLRCRLVLQFSAGRGIFDFD